LVAGRRHGRSRCLDLGRLGPAPGLLQALLQLVELAFDRLGAVDQLLDQSRDRPRPPCGQLLGAQARLFEMPPRLRLGVGDDPRGGPLGRLDDRFESYRPTNP
jgi:hypothetical protein